MTRLHEISELFFSYRNDEGQDELQRWYDQRLEGTGADRDAALGELCSCLDVRLHQLRALFCLYGGALIENDADPAPLARAMLAPLEESLACARRLVTLRRAMVSEQDESDEQDDEDDEQEPALWVDQEGLSREVVEQLREQDREALDAFRAMDIWYRPFVAALSRSPGALREARARPILRELVDELRDACPGVSWMHMLLHALLDESVIVLVPELRQGFRVKAPGCVTMGQFTTLLSDPLDATFRQVGAAGRAPPEALDVARGLGPQVGDDFYGANVHFFPWPAMDAATGLPSRGNYQWRAPGGCGTGSLPADYLPVDAPLLDGERVLLMVGPRSLDGFGFIRELGAARTFSALMADLQAAPLPPDEAARWLARVADESGRHRADGVT